MKDILIHVMIGLIIGGYFAYWCHDCVAEASDPMSTTEAIQFLQSRHSDDLASKLADVFDRAGYEADIDPLLLVAISSRESALIPGVIGSLGERGLMQVHGVALSARPEECSHHLQSIDCQVRTGARWLAWAKRQCPGPTDRWVSAYGRSKCPSIQVAIRDRGVRIVKSRYAKIGGKRW